MDDLNAFERTIAHELSLMGGPHGNVDAAGIATGVTAAAPRRGSNRRGMAIGLVVGVALLGGLFVALMLAGVFSSESEPDGSNEPGSVASNRPGTSPSTTPTPQPTITGRRITTPRTWARRPLPATERASGATMGVGPNDEILVVAAATELIDRPHGWLSSDRGASWARTNLGLRRRDQAVPASVAVWNERFVVVGHDADGGFVSASPDGRAWSRLASIPNAELQEVHATPDGLIARGYDIAGRQRDRRHHPAVFTSADGISWDTHRVAVVGSPDRQAKRTDLQTFGLARSDDGVTLVPGLHVNGGAPGVIAADDVGQVGVTSLTGLYWRSTDDASWTALPLPVEHTSTSAGPDFVRVTDVRWTPFGFFMALQVPDPARSSRVGSIWHSLDGLAWTQVADTRRSAVGRIVSDGADLLAFTSPVAERNSEGMWLIANAIDPELRSSDGADWRPLEDPAFSRFEVRHADITSDGTVVALGHARLPGDIEALTAPAWELLVGTEESD